ncbi:MAG: retroviral-like aspartic protease [Candidatus Aenigmarchaeota archaeon]|nr:retroviral-like aspartic protease [Candidatus Aenigmarchaeota archaeon]
MRSAEFDYKEQDSAIFGKVKRPLIEMDVFSESEKVWLPLYKVLADTGADISILPRYIGKLIVADILEGRRINIRGIVPHSRIVCYIHALKLRVGSKEFKLPVAIAESDNVPIVLGRVSGLDIFNCSFNGKRIHMSW